MDDPYPNTSLIIQILIIVLLIIFNAVLTLYETAAVALNDSKLEKMAEDGHKKAKRVLKLTQNAQSFVSVSQNGFAFAGFFVCAFASQTFAGRLINAVAPLLPQAFPHSVLKGVCILIVALIASFVILLFGKLIPQKLAMQSPEKIAFAGVGFLTFCSKLAKPMASLLTVSTKAIIRLFGLDPNKGDEIITEEEIRMLVDEGEENGVIENVQKEMINNIFEFDDIDASDIMTHRTDVCAVDVNDTLEQVISESVKNGYSRIPVFEDELDNIIGVAYVKDLLPFVGKELPAGKNLRSIIRKAYYIPESKPCGKLFTEMTESHVQMAVVVDEYGGTAGIVTLEDLLESIVGNIQDEYDNEAAEISQIDDATFTVDGATDIDEVSDLIDIEFPDDDYDTLGGFLINKLGYLPKDGDMDTVEYENYRFTILSVEDRRIGKVRLEILPKPQTEDEENEKDGIKEKRREREKQS